MSSTNFRILLEFNMSWKSRRCEWKRKRKFRLLTSYVGLKVKPTNC